MKDSELNFTWNFRINEILETVELVENGENIMLHDSNKELFVEKVYEYLLKFQSLEFYSYFSIKDKVDSLKKGFYSIIPTEIIKTFCYYELDYLLSGQSEIDIYDWKSNTVYRGKYSENHQVKFLNIL